MYPTRTQRLQTPQTTPPPAVWTAPLLPLTTDDTRSLPRLNNTQTAVSISLPCSIKEQLLQRPIKRCIRAIFPRTRKHIPISTPYWNRVCRTEVYSSDSPANCQKTIFCLPSVSNLVSPQSVILRTCATVSAKQSTCCLSSLDVVQFTRISPCTVSAAYHRTDSGLSRYRATYAMFRHLRPTQ